MNADNMFFSMGYYKNNIEGKNSIIAFCYSNEQCDDIYFYLDEKKIVINGELSMQELKAINMKCKELRMG